MLSTMVVTDKMQGTRDGGACILSQVGYARSVGVPYNTKLKQKHHGEADH